MISLGDWTPSEPMQGIHMDCLCGDLYSIRAVGIMSGLAAHAIPVPGVLAYDSRAEEYGAICQASAAQIKGFATYYGGVAIKTAGGWIIKGIAPKMRAEITLA